MTSVPETTSNTAAPAAQLITVELPELLGIAGTAHAAALEALAAVLADAHVFDDLSPDANRVAELVAYNVIPANFDLIAAADALRDRANEVLVDRRGGWDDRSAAGLAMHRAARVLEGAGAPTPPTA
jgi:hypothetical protein